MKKIFAGQFIFFAVYRAITFLFFLCVALSNHINAQQKVIKLYNGTAPGSETWNWEEKEFKKSIYYQ